jgi:MFS family permease
VQERRERPGLRQAVAALQHRDYRLFYVALLAAAIGGQFQSTASLIQIYDLTHSPLHLGLTGLARGLPTFVLSLMGGVFADRVDRRLLIFGSQAVNGLGAIVLAALTVSGLIDVWHIYAVMLLNGSLAALSSPARSALIPNLVPRHHLLNAIALNSTVWQTANIVGPSLAGLMISAIAVAAGTDASGSMALGLAAAYAANGLTHLITLGALAAMRMGPVPPRPREGALRSVVVGLSFISRERSIILALLATDSAAMLFGTYRALTPIFADALGVGPEGIGLLFAAPGVGSLLGAAVIMSLGDFRYKGWVVVGGILAYCVGLAVFALSPWFSLSLITSVALGVFDSVQATPRNGVIQLLTPDELRGRVSAFQYMLVNGMPSLGQTLSGGAAALLGAPLALTVGAAICAVIVLGIAAARPDLRDENLGATPAPRPTAVPTV